MNILHLFFFRVILQMNILAIFLVLGVGADDIFVLVDSWKQSRVDVKPREVSEREGG